MQFWGRFAVATTIPPPAGSPPRFSCLVYRTGNLGDVIQTMALTRLMPPMTGVFRHALGTAPVDRTFVVNGFLERDTTPRAGASCLFAGVSGPYEQQASYYRWLGRSRWPVGARDPASVLRLAAAGLDAELAGCATLTFPRFEGPRSGVLAVDCDGPGERITHAISRTLTVEGQWRRGRELLDRYRSAEAVYTSRLHVALPCLAFGTPVSITRPDPRVFPQRFSLLEELGVPFGELTVRDVSGGADRYRSFLERHLGITIEAGEPQPPTLAKPDRLHLRAATRFALEDFNWSLRLRVWKLLGWS